MREKSYLFAMNGGEVSPLALGRVDLSRMRISAEVMKNCYLRLPTWLLDSKLSLKKVHITHSCWMMHLC